MNFQREGSGRIKRFLRRNGIYLALAISILAVVAIVIAGLTQQLTQKKPSGAQNAQQQVEQKVTGEKDSRTTTATTTTTQTTTTTSHSTVESAPSLYLLPLTNTVQKPFSSDGPLYCETMRDWRIHMGVDFAGEEGQAVTSVTRGEVVSVRTDPLWGGVIEIDHGVGIVTRYCGVKSIVRVGDTVDAGTHIGDLQTIPCECAQSPHLHLEMMVEGMPIDPVAAIGLEVRYAETTE